MATDPPTSASDGQQDRISNSAAYALAQIITDAVVGAERSEANGPEVGLFVLDALDMAGYKVVSSDD